MRLDPEVAAGVGEAVNELARASLACGDKTTRFRQRPASVGLKLDVANVAEALELLDQDDAEDSD